MPKPILFLATTNPPYLAPVTSLSDAPDSAGMVSLDQDVETDFMGVTSVVPADRCFVYDQSLFQFVHNHVAESLRLYEVATEQINQRAKLAFSGEQILSDLMPADPKVWH